MGSEKVSEMPVFLPRNIGRMCSAEYAAAVEFPVQNDHLERLVGRFCLRQAGRHG